MSAVRFCPFCREAFEDHEACPEHGLALVEFQQLPRADGPLDESAWLPWSTMAYGRVWLLLAAGMLLVAFFTPFASMTGGFEGSSTLYGLAQKRAKILWMVPAAALGLLAVLHRRRTLRGLRSARLVVAWLALVPLAVVGLRLFGSFQAAARLGAKLGEPVAVHPGAGTWLVAVASLVVLFAVPRLGRARPRQVPVRELH